MQNERYQRQIILEGFGMEAQEKLSKARVLVIGAGGLGCPVLQYLVAAGVGYIGIADDDVVSYSNLNRQVLYGQGDVGKSKVMVAKEKLLLMNDKINITTWQQRWSQVDCVNHFATFDIIVDATDNFASKYLINDACVLLKKPLVFGAVSKYEGQIAVFKTLSYRDIFPVPPNNSEVLNCAQGGVLGVLPGIIGVMQATEVIKLITGIGELLTDKILTYNALSQQIYTMQLVKNPQTENMIPSGIDAFVNTDYEWLCGLNNSHVKELDVEEWLNIKESMLLVDIREKDELPILDKIQHVKIPLSILNKFDEELLNRNLIFICQSGVRSIKAAAVFLSDNPSVKVYSLKGGVNELIKKKII